jgi:transposase InsO family protein
LSWRATATKEELIDCFVTLWPLSDDRSSASSSATGWSSARPLRVIRLPYRSPRANSFAERWLGTARRELLDHLLIFERRHFERLLIEFIEYYHEARPHQGLGRRRPHEPAGEILLADGPVERGDLLGGLLHEHQRAA